MRNERLSQSASALDATSGSSRVAVDITHVIANLILLPFRLLWDLFLISLVITLEILWLGFVFGSVVAVILLLMFWVEGFLLPLAPLVGLVSLWPDQEKN